MKLKLDQIRTYDDFGFRRRAACLCFKSECESEVLLVSSSRFNDLWIVPGGGLEPGEDPASTAVREVNEEAGVVGRLGRLLDVFENEDRKTRTYVYVLIVERLEDDYDDASKIGRLRKWFSIDEANSQLLQHRPIQQEYFDKLCKDKIHQRKVSQCNEASLSRPFVFGDVCTTKETFNQCVKCSPILKCPDEMPEQTRDMSINESNPIVSSLNDPDQSQIAIKSSQHRQKLL